MSGLQFPIEDGRIIYPEIDLSREPGGEEDEIVDDKLFVAVGKDFNENKSTVIWALQNSGGKKICIIHVHTPSQSYHISVDGLSPVVDGKLPKSQVGKPEVSLHHEKEKMETLKALDDYIQLCAKAGVNAQKILLEAESIENGIIALIKQKRIGRLVMGAAADNKYKKSMTTLKSQKAINIKAQAPVFCHILFICKGYLIFTREGVKPPYPNHSTQEPNFLNPQLKTAVPDSLYGTDQETYTSGSYGMGGDKRVAVDFSAPRTSDRSFNAYEHLRRIGASESPRSSMASEAASDSPLSIASKGKFALEMSPLDQNIASFYNSPRSQEKDMNEELCPEIDKLMAEVENLREQAFSELMKLQRAEREIIEAVRKAKEMESSYHKEWKQRRELEEKLAKEAEELDVIRNVHANLIEEHGSALYQKSFLENEIDKLNVLVDELDEKIFSAVGLLEKYKKRQEDLETERDNALYEAESLRKQHDLLGSKTEQNSRFFADFTFSEIAQATDDFNRSNIIGEGGFGSIYKGLLHHTEVAVKILNPESMQGHKEFKQEIDALSKLRHPNIVTLIGVCSEASALIYEYLPNGSLEDRLACKGNTPPLSWQTRIQIAAELCSALMFLHSFQPQCIIHGDLKPENILLDAHLSCKLSDFGICRAIANGQGSIDDTTRLYTTDPKGTFAYIDPEFIITGELTPMSDVYSFGIILLRLLTGKSALGIPNVVQKALDEGNLHDLSDPSAGHWPFVQAKQLALLALRCCEMRRNERPELVGDVWRVIEPMRLSCRSSSSPRLVGDEHDHVPSYFVCPIFQEVMQDPQIAADGYTYEAEALRGWLDSGHNTSPMTNLKLANLTLVPNHALRSAIQEWLQHN